MFKQWLELPCNFLRHRDTICSSTGEERMVVEVSARVEAVAAEGADTKTYGIMEACGSDYLKLPSTTAFCLLVRRGGEVTKASKA